MRTAFNRNSGSGTWVLRHLCAAMLLAAMAAMGPNAGYAADEKGWFGLAMAIDVEGNPLNPKLRSIKVDKIIPASPAASAGIAQGDEILEVEGIRVAGASADAVKTAVQKKVGETLHLKVQRGTEPPRTVSLIAALKPSP
jgi:C-terminal processing protease CtpA/Prc